MAQELSDCGSSKPVPPTMTLSLLTWNVNKSFPRRVSQQGSANRRDTIIPLVLDHLDKQGHVVLIQESTIKEDKAKSRWGMSTNYQQQEERKGLHQGIDTTLDVMYMPSLSDQIDSLVPEGATDKADALKQADRDAGFADEIIVTTYNDRRLMRSNIAHRTFARKLEVTPEEAVIVISFHSIYKRANKDDYIHLFFNLMCRLAQVHQCPVLIGGDFNLPVGDWRRDIERGFGGRVSVAEIYPPTPRRRSDNIIDTFAVAYPPGRRITCTLSKPVAVYPFPDRAGDGSDQFKVVEFSDSNKRNIKRLLPKTDQGITNWRKLWHDLDHDPVCVTVTLQFPYYLPRDTPLQFPYFPSPPEFGYHDPILVLGLLLSYMNLLNILRLLQFGPCDLVLRTDIALQFSHCPMLPDYRDPMPFRQFEPSSDESSSEISSSDESSSNESSSSSD